MTAAPVPPGVGPPGVGTIRPVPGATPPPWRPEEAGTDWLTDALRGAGVVGGRRVVAFDTEPVGTGQMADCVRFRLTYDADAPGAPGTLVGKFTPADRTSRATALALRTSEVEVRFYQEVAATVGVRTPRCYAAEVDPATGEFALLLEDLAPARQGDQVAGCSPDQASLALAELARLHAPRWGDPSLEHLPWLERQGPEPGAMAEVLPVLFGGFVERYGDQLDPAVIGVGERLFPRIGDYLRRRPGPRTVQHADYRLDNLLFTDEPRAVAVVDWQTTTLGPGAADVSYFVGAGLATAERRQHETDLVREYHERLCAGGVPGYSWDDCMTDYRRHAYAGYVMAVGASMLVERTARGDDMFLTMARRHAAQIEDLGAESLLGAA